MKDILDKIHRKLEKNEIGYYKAKLSSAESILKELSNIKSINKFEIEDLVAKAKSHLNPKIYSGDY